MSFVVRRLREMGQRWRISLRTYFVDVQKAYDLVDGEVQWQVLARAAIPGELMAISGQFHDGMQPAYA